MTSSSAQNYAGPTRHDLVVSAFNRATFEFGFEAALSGRTFLLRSPQKVAGPALLNIPGIVGGNTATVPFSDAQTGALGVSTFELRETTGGTDRAVLAGTLRATAHPGEATLGPVSVLTSDDGVSHRQRPPRLRWRQRHPPGVVVAPVRDRRPAMRAGPPRP